MNNLCEYGEYVKNGMDVKLVCSINNFNCSYVRWCISESCLKMKENHLKCNGRVKMELKYKEVEDNIELKKKTKTNKEKCKILRIKENKIEFDFCGYGISYDIKNFKKQEFVEVEYSGKIGNKNFKIISVK